MHRLIAIAVGTGLAGPSDLRQTLSHLQAAWRLLELEPDSAEKANAAAVLSWVGVMANLDVEEAPRNGEQAVTIAERLNAPDLVAHASALLGTVLAYTGRLGEAEECAERGWAASLQGKDAFYKTAAALFPLLYWPSRNDRGWSERWLERYREYRQRLHVERFDRPAYGLVALIAALCGKPQEAGEAVRRAEEIGARHPSQYAYLAYYAAAAHAVLGNSEQARRLFALALEAAASSSAKAPLLEGSVHYGRFLLASDEPGEAEALLERASAVAHAHGTVVQELSLLPLRCELFVRTGRLDEAGRSLKRAREILARPEAWRGLTAGVYHAEGLLAAVRRDWAEAEQSFTKALDAERAYGFLYNEAHVLVPWAELCLKRNEPGDRERALQLLDQALAIFRQCEAKKEIQRVLARTEALTA